MLIQITQQLSACLRDHSEIQVSFRKSEVVSRSWAALQVFGERVRKAMLSELIPGGG